MSLTLLDPTAESEPVARPRIARPPELAGLRIGLLDIAKMRGDEFLDRVDELFAARGIAVKRYKKRIFMDRAAPELVQQIRSECDVVVEGLAD